LQIALKVHLWNSFMKQIDFRASKARFLSNETTQNRPPNSRLPPNAYFARPHHRRHHNRVYISCYQSRHRQKFLFGHIARAAHSYSQAWRTLAAMWGVDPRCWNVINPSHVGRRSNGQLAGFLRGIDKPQPALDVLTFASSATLCGLIVGYLTTLCQLFLLFSIGLCKRVVTWNNCCGSGGFLLSAYYPGIWKDSCYK
jgi:hypothetical protein